MSIQREVPGIRFAETNRDDSMQAIALRELGDSSRWPELVSLNQLIPPFITDDTSLAGAGVLLGGQLIKIPATDAVVATLTRDTDIVFESDLSLDAGDLQADAGGDFAIVSGLPNLRQALSHRLDTDRGELGFHPEYGSLLRRIVGTVNGPTAGLLAASYAKSAVAADPRIQQVTSSDATVAGDRVTVDLVAQPVVGRTIDITQTV